LLYERGEREASRRDLDRAVLIDPQCTVARVASARAHMHRGESGEARAEADETTLVAPGSALSWVTCAEAREASGDLADALRAASRAVECDGRSGRAHLIRGRIRARTN